MRRGGPGAKNGPMVGTPEDRDAPSPDAGDGPQPTWSPEERRLLDALEGETLAPADVAVRAEVDLGAALAALTSLELAGAVRRVPGGLYGRR